VGGVVESDRELSLHVRSPHGPATPGTLAAAEPEQVAKAPHASEEVSEVFDSDLLAAESTEPAGPGTLAKPSEST
jgi:hypothetical protein